MKDKELEEAACKHADGVIGEYRCNEVFRPILTRSFLAGAHHVTPISVERTVDAVIEIIKNQELWVGEKQLINQIQKLKP